MTERAFELVPTDRVYVLPSTSATEGRIVWSPAKSLWFTAHSMLGLVGVVFFASWGAAAVFLLLTAGTICAGHSVGMHRLLIHRSFETPLWLERTLVWLGTLVGMAGPFGMIRAHDMRDWHQRQKVCPPHPSHGTGFWRDFWWQIHCAFRLDRPPEFRIEDRVATDPFYRFVERTWMLQQIPLAAILWFVGGMGFVLWGVSLRIGISLFGHWMVGHYSHKNGHQGWEVSGLPVQGYNLPGISFLTFGENWHGNHHAFPHSARLGIERNQMDPGFWFISVLRLLGLAHNIQQPNNQPPRDGLRRVGDSSTAH